jgi:MFS transporter, NNP family, nitrate/nitrite transporter
MASMRGFLKSGHWPSLLASCLYFDISFMVWVLLGALSVFVSEDVNLTASQKGWSPFPFWVALSSVFFWSC